MSAGRLDLYVEKGATWRHTLFWELGDPPVPVNLAAYSARMKIRSPGPGGGSTEIAELTTENGRIMLGDSGRIDLHINAEDTSALLGLAGIYDLEMVNGVEVTRLVQGEVQISPEVTR